VLLSRVFSVKDLRELIEDALGKVNQDFVLGLCSCSNTSRLEREGHRQESIGGIDIGGNSSVGMHSEDFTVIIKGKRLSEFNVASLVSVAGNEVSATFSKRVVLVVDHIGVEVVGQVELNQTLVLGISDSTSIVSLCHHVVKGFIRHLLELIQEEHQLLLGDTQVRHSEGVLNIPTEGSELSTLQNKGIEEAKTVEQTLECFRLFALVELLVSDVVLVRTNQVVSDSIRRLKSSLDGVLDDGHRELVRG